VICRIDVTTVNDTGNEAIIPAAEDRKPTSIDVSKKKPAMISVKSQPIAPLVSAAYFILIIRNTIRTIGSSVSVTDEPLAKVRWR
jgi:hypothetical protein